MKKSKLLALLLALTMLLSLAACGGKDGDSKGDDQLLSGKVYVPEFIDFDVGLTYIDSGCSDGKNVYVAGTVSTETEETDPATGEILFDAGHLLSKEEAALRLLDRALAFLED